MIISASRRTDIPAFYSEWLIKRTRAGYCTVPNPFNKKQVSRVSLAPEEVDVIVFWTRNPRPLFPWLDELDRRGFRYYFQYTLLGYPRALDPKTPSENFSVSTFRRLADRIGSTRLIWRYDPIVFTTQTPPEYHLAAYRRICEILKGYAHHSVISLMDDYPKIRRRMAELDSYSAALTPPSALPHDEPDAMLSGMATVASENGMKIVSCAEERDLSALGICAGKCVDDEYIREVFHIEAAHQKDPSQRKACGCVLSKDIGMYDTCLFGCRYCYATNSFERARANYADHDPDSPSLIG
jgi:hypothetical protein